MPEIRFRSIASHLIRRIVLLAVLCMMVFVTLLAGWEYRAGKRSFKQDMEQHVSASLLLVSTALWDIDPAIVRKQVQWLSQLPQVGYVRVHSSTTGESFESGRQEAAPQRPPALQLSIPVPRDLEGAAGRETSLGTLEVWESRRYYFGLIRNSILGLIVGYLVFTVMVCLVVMTVMRRQLRNPLRQIAAFARGLKPNGQPQALVLNREPRDHVDEIDLVARGFVQLQHDLQNHIAHLDQLVAQRTAQLEQVVEEVRRLSMTDALTGSLNRRALDERLQAEVERSCRYLRPLCAVFMDIDHFKHINDQYGHGAGDLILQQVVQRCLKGLRAQVDWLARYGGEEFLAVLPESDVTEGVQLARRLGEAIRDQAFEVDGHSLRVTASFGVAQLRSGESMESLLFRADAALYEAKAAGRDVVYCGEQMVLDREKTPAT